MTTPPDWIPTSAPSENWTPREDYSRLLDHLPVEVLPEGLQDEKWGIAGEPLADELDIDPSEDEIELGDDGYKAHHRTYASPEELLQQVWGYSTFRPQQREIIQSLLDNKDTLGLLPTGGGKSITFQIPALLKEGITLVVSPLIALMKDQVDNLRKKKIKAALIHSGMSRKEIERIADNCIYGRYKFLYISPERLQSESFLDTLLALKISMIVVDECHCISQWGYDFRPSYLHIAQIREYFPQVPILALTATATPRVVEDIMQQLRFREKNVLSVSFFRPNLAYVVRKTSHKMETLLHILSKVSGSAIVYCRNRLKTKEIAEMLTSAGVSADFFHAGLTYAERELKQNSWMREDIRVMVSTNAFGMGIDKPNVRTVIHWTLPNSIEEYFQEAGRAGRDGGKSYAVALVNPTETKLLKKRISDDFPPLDYVRKIYETVCSDLKIGFEEGYQRSFLLDIPKILRKHKLNPTHFMSALKILETSGLWRLHSEESRSRLVMEIRREDFYDRNDLSEEEEQTILAILRNYAGVFADYVFIDERKIAFDTQLSTQQTYETLIRLSKLGVLHYIPQKRLPSLFFNFRRESSQTILIPKSVYHDRKQALTERIGAMIAYVTRDKNCRSDMLLSYFGDDSHCACGMCDVCTRHTAQGVRRYRIIEVEDWLRKNWSPQSKKIELRTLQVALSLTEEEARRCVEVICGECPNLAFDGVWIRRG